MSFDKLLPALSIVFGLLLFGLGVTNLIDGQPDDLEQEQALYCEMVTTHKTTGGEYGWPDYRGVYERACK